MILDNNIFEEESTKKFCYLHEVILKRLEFGKNYLLTLENNPQNADKLERIYQLMEPIKKEIT